MPVGAAVGASAVVGAGASMYAGSKQAKAAKSAANNERAMMNAQRADNEKFYQRGRKDIFGGANAAEDVIERYDDFGVRGNALTSALGGIGGSAAQQAALRADPGYQFRLSEGIGALDRSAAARGGLLSGGHQKALMAYGQGLASDELNNAFGRAADVRDSGMAAANNLAQLRMDRGTAAANLAVGQASQNQALRQNTSNALSNLRLARGQAAGGAAEGVASSVNAGLQNGLTAYMMRQPGSTYGSGMYNGTLLRGTTGRLGGGV